MVKKILPFVIISIILAGFIPVKPFNRFLPDDSYELVIMGQEMGCPCPEFRIIRGELGIPDSILTKYPNLYTDEINLSAGSLFEEYNYEIAHQELFVNGRIISIEQLTEDSCVPVFEVSDWKINTYIPTFLILSKNKIIMYFSLSVLGLIYSFTKRVSEKKSGRVLE